MVQYSGYDIRKHITWIWFVILVASIPISLLYMLVSRDIGGIEYILIVLWDLWLTAKYRFLLPSALPGKDLSPMINSVIVLEIGATLSVVAIVLFDRLYEGLTSVLETGNVIANRIILLVLVIILTRMTIGILFGLLKYYGTDDEED